ncbi:hypothetical protein GCM10025865_14400 [Paraoerskovia sediminicola]|uniref:DUF7933 domain-containing protein n=1 Tax=Paraoerskovia sediminicola TaxID=1138587 RepID=A0ABM8G294_9CELL|nr:hypothetical protein GCM10025865_14400 [Paraoerskovia sediminicola]
MPVTAVVAPVAPAAAVPGQPGVMEAPANFFAENFENVTWPEPVGETQIGTNPDAWDAADWVQTLTEYPFDDDGTAADFQAGYVNENGTTTYSADAQWAAGTFCNGFITAAHGNQAFSNLNSDAPLPASAPAQVCGDARSWNSVRLLANVMGQYHLNANQNPYFGQGLGDPADPLENHVVSSYTAGSGIDPGTMLEFDEPIDVDPGRYYQASIDIAAMSCITSGNGAIPQIFLTQSDGSESPVFSNAINTCNPGGLGEIFQYGPGGGANNIGRQRTTRVGTFLSDQALRSTGDTLGIRINNDQAATAGNDSAFDNIVVLDTTPKIDKEFSAYPGPGSDGVYPTGADGTLTFTITNTFDPIDPEEPSGPKEDFSFVDTINDGDLQLTGTSETTCGDGTVTVDTGAGTVALDGGDLVDPNLVSCTVTVGVTSDVAGTYTNGPDDMELVGLNPRVTPRSPSRSRARCRVRRRRSSGRSPRTARRQPSSTST